MTKAKIIYTSLVVCLGIVLPLGCAPKKLANNTPAVNLPEESYCSTITAVADPVTLTGVAEYQYLKPDVSAGGLTLDVGDIPFTSRIRFAEVRIKDPSGKIVQCGETDNNGNYSVKIAKPANITAYTIEVNARGDNNSVKASILDQPAVKKIYTLSTSISVANSDIILTVPKLTALATGTMEGAAFHIFDKILAVNDYLRANSTNQYCSICQAFAVAPKVTVYWRKGFNPSSYINEVDGLSFFDASGSVIGTTDPSLFILGGDNGDVDHADTDHFDDSVIIHEYGHFLEKHYWKTDSPGGFHNGNLIIDPRLAFSEGFANFLPSAVTGSSEYIDTLGSPYGLAQIGIYINLEDEPNATDSGRDRILSINPVGEGVYREVSVSRVLNDYIDNNQDSILNSNGTQSPTVKDKINLPFAFLWLALTNSEFGLNASKQHFVSIGHFNKALYDGLNSAYTNTDIATQLSELAEARTSEFQTNGTSEYAQPLVKTAGSCLKTMTPVTKRPIMGTPTTPDESKYYQDIFASSDFFQVQHPGGLFDLKLVYTPTNSNQPPDIDLYVYAEAHELGEVRDLVASSDKCRSDLSDASISASCGSFESPVGTESISQSLPAGTYMVLVNAVTTSYFSGGSATYQLSSGGQSLCNSQ